MEYRCTSPSKRLCDGDSRLLELEVNLITKAIGEILGSPTTHQWLQLVSTLRYPPIHRSFRWSVALPFPFSFITTLISIRLYANDRFRTLFVCFLSPRQCPALQLKPYCLDVASESLGNNSARGIALLRPRLFQSGRD